MTSLHNLDFSVFTLSFFPFCYKVFGRQIDRWTLFQTSEYWEDGQSREQVTKPSEGVCSFITGEMGLLFFSEPSQCSWRNM